MFDSPVVKLMLMNVLKSFLSKQKIHGVYIFLDDKGEAQILEYKKQPKNDE
jgi:hypothetical protein